MIRVLGAGVAGVGAVVAGVGAKVAGVVRAVVHRAVRVQVLRSIWWAGHLGMRATAPAPGEKKPSSVAGLDFCCFGATHDNKALS